MFEVCLLAATVEIQAVAAAAAAAAAAVQALNEVVTTVASRRAKGSTTSADVLDAGAQHSQRTALSCVAAGTVLA